MTRTVKDEILEEISRLDPPQQQKVLDFARHLTDPAGAPLVDLSPFIGLIEPADLDSMTRAIAAGCEEIDENAW